MPIANSIPNTNESEYVISGSLLHVVGSESEIAHNIYELHYDKCGYCEHCEHNVEISFLQLIEHTFISYLLFLR